MKPEQQPEAVSCVTSEIITKTILTILVPKNLDLYTGPVCEHATKEKSSFYKVLIIIKYFLDEKGLKKCLFLMGYGSNLTPLQGKFINENILFIV